MTEATLPVAERVSAPALDVVEVHVRSVERAPWGDLLLGAHIDQPVAGSRSERPLLEVEGWVVGSGPQALRVEVHHRGVVIGRLGVERPRADIAALYPDREDAARAGFAGVIEAFTLPSTFELTLIAVFEDERRTGIGRIVGEWEPPVESPSEHIQPVMLTTLGRSGSTWVTRLLGAHAEVLAFAPFRAEPRAASYWFSMYGALAGPRSFDQVLRAELNGPDWWVGSERPRSGPVRDDDMTTWLANEHVRATLPLAVQQVERFAREASRQEGKDERVRFFCEKLGLETFIQPFLTDLYPGAREIILVRDPRDMICSIHAFNAKRGVVEFGRGEVESDEAYVHWWRGGLEQLLAEWKARADTAYLLRYEDLMLEPETSLGSLLEYLGVDADPDTVRDVLKRASGMGRDAQKLHQTAANPAASIGRWRKDFSAAEHAAAAEAFPDILDAFGYER